MEQIGVTDEEKGILAIVRLNKFFDKTEITKSVTLGRLRINFNWRSKSNLWGRFGGGFDWCLGFGLGGRTLILNCLIFSLRFDFKRKKDAQED